jgi:hypothetical protein
VFYVVLKVGFGFFLLHRSTTGKTLPIIYISTLSIFGVGPPPD